MKFSEYPKLGLLGTIVGVVIIAILLGSLLLGIWIDFSIPIAYRIGATIFIVFFGGGLIAVIIGGYKLLHHEVFFPKAEKIIKDDPRNSVFVTIIGIIGIVTITWRFFVEIVNYSLVGKVLWAGFILLILLLWALMLITAYKAPATFRRELKLKKEREAE